MSKLIITKMQIHSQERTVTALVEEGKVLELRLSSLEQEALLGSIYIGKVKNVSPNLDAAFVELSPGVTGYLPLSKELPYFTNPKKDNIVKAGDEVLVQVNREPLKSKAYNLTSNLSFTGKYLVLTSQRCQLSLSSKLNGEDRERLRKWLVPCMETEFGLIVRTNSKEAEKQEILAELEYLKKRWRRVIDICKGRTCYSLLEKASPFYIQAVRDAYGGTLEEIVTDIPCIFTELREYLAEYQKEDTEKLRLYEDRLLSLHKLYSLERALDHAAKEKVWLPSGGFLMIQQTEAFVAVDVNTGKYTGKKKQQETYRKINLEAAREIAAQLRLRNLSGIILIDFINLERKEHQEELLNVFKKYLRRDPVHTVLVDMTKLNIVEVTRKKVRKSLAEEIGGK